MATTDSRGFFVWHELMSTDPEAAKTFYKKVIGWKTQPFAESGPGSDYHMWAASQGPLGGVMKLPPEAEKADAPQHWFSHVNVADTDTSAAKAKQLGAKILHGPETVPQVGRFSIIQDPQGAMLSLYTPEKSAPPHDSEKHGEFCWSELITSDHKAAFDFYNQLFGWEKIGSHDMGAMGEYLLFGVRGKRLGGMFTKGAETKMPSVWMYYIEVDDLDGAVAQATQSGGRVMNGPMEVPGGARIAQLQDPQGGAFALHSAKGR